MEKMQERIIEMERMESAESEPHNYSKNTADSETFLSTFLTLFIGSINSLIYQFT